ncbi:hypothetical protein C2S53_017739 [Perilla frutescens var. hirtella]|uniref:Protein TILLER ANGLE CONTROL 1 n=1 Tax=Perilla frutescens var. hirtella TaxID=608512 RepID=A0AAD4IME2_PERFH|nr:hypothetical protein C2S53_017739 [Perilla frutescens var. hirtella]
MEENSVYEENSPIFVEGSTIFNWVHRRFNNKAENAKKNDDIDAVDDEQFPVENKCNHVFERWRGGILTIGTLGYDPLKDDENEQAVDDYSFYEEEDDDDIDIDIEGEDSDSDSDEEEVETEDEEQNPLVVEVGMEEKWNDHEDELQFGYEYVMMKKQERTTLADLFSADSDQDHHHLIMKKQPKPVNNSNNNNKVNPSELLKDKSNRKHSLSKLITAKDARPIHKFNQLMRRMLKRKIHPDVGPINSKPAPVINKCRPTDDYASLLPTQAMSKLVSAHVSLASSSST